MDNSTQSAFVYFSIGTNLGNRLHNLCRALSHMTSLGSIEAVSGVYETAPWGPIQDQPNFFNICIAASCFLSPIELLDAIKSIEVEIGREVSEKWGPRLIDIDILFYNDLRVDHERLAIPHPQIEKRGFVLVPLNEIAPDLLHPITQRGCCHDRFA